jgi:iron complex outermembrane receptor protein
MRKLVSSPLFLEAGGNRSLQAEDLLAYEMGYRVQETKTFAWDVAVFYNDYENLSTLNPLGPPAGFPPTLPFQFDNVASGSAYGFETTAQWELQEWWRVSGWYSFLQLQIDGANSFAQIQIEEASPHNQVAFLSSWDLPRHLEFDLISRYVDDVPIVNVARYISLDVRLGWRPNEEWEFSIVGQNLLEEHRREFVDHDSDSQPTEVNRGVYAQATWRH